MRINKIQILSILLMFMSAIALGQSNVEKLIHCKIIAEGTTVNGVNVLNLVNQKNTISDVNGEFYILAKYDDVLLMTAVNLEIKRKLIEEEDLQLELIKIKMIPKNTELKEVRVNEYANITSASIGIVPKDQKKYTPAERKLYTAQSGLIDPLINWMSGRTTMLKKEVEVEKKERLLVKLDGQFENQYYIQELKIPEAYIKGFQYFLVEEEEFVKALLAKNKTLMKYLLPKLALKYNNIINYEN